MDDLRGTNKARRVRTGSGGKIVGAAILAAVVGAVVAYSYQSGTFGPHRDLRQMFATNQIQSPSPPAQDSRVPPPPRPQ